MPRRSGPRRTNRKNLRNSMRKGMKRRKNTMRRRNTNRKVRRNTKYTKRKNTRRNFRWMGGMTPRAGTPKRLRPSTPQGTPPAEPAVGQRPPAPKNLPEDTLRELVEVINNQHMRWHYYAISIINSQKKNTKKIGCTGLCWAQGRLDFGIHKEKLSDSMRAAWISFSQTLRPG